MLKSDPICLGGPYTKQGATLYTNVSVVCTEGEAPAVAPVGPEDAGAQNQHLPKERSGNEERRNKTAKAASRKRRTNMAASINWGSFL